MRSGKLSTKPARFLLLLLPALIWCPYGAAQPAAVSAPKGPTIGKCSVFPADNIWNTPVDKLPVDPRSATYVRSIGADKPLHPDYGSDVRTGIPFQVVNGTQRKIRVTVPAGESDLDPVPVPANPRLENGDDSHLLVVDQDNCRLYELFAAKPTPDGGWKADSAAHYDLRSNALRPDGWTSADAAGLPIFPGLVRWDEVASGEIRHAIRFTAPKTQRAYLWPGRHFASRSADPALPPMGLRMRLRADFDISGFSKETQVILRALKKYGMILADNGGPWFITGSGDPHWPNGMPEEMRRVMGSNFEAVNASSLMRGPNTAAALDPTPTAGPGTAKGPMIGKCPVLPADSIWNTPVDKLPVDPRSSNYVRSIGAEKPLHPDYGGDVRSGIPFQIVPGTQRKLRITVPPDESDTDPVPVPDTPRLENGSDSHLLVIDQDACRLYELFAAKPIPGGGWKADSAAHYDLRSNVLRPDGWTSADAAGLPIFPGLVRWDEVAAGEIKHAIRFTAPATQRAYVWPARHFASRSADPNLPPMGLRMRLKADFDISGFSKETQVILRALKKYGMILSDNGGAWYITGTGDPHWPGGMAEEMRRVVGSNFEAVDASSLMRGPHSAAAVDPNPVTAAGAPAGPTIGKCPVFPANNILNTAIDKMPVDPRSAAYVRTIGADKPLHPDYGSDLRSGMPFHVVSGTQRKVKIVVPPGESDTDPVPIPANPRLENGSDSHLVVIDQDACRLYELFAAKPTPDGGWKADSAAHYDLRSNALRPDGWTSADAAGLPIFAGLVRWEEVAAGEIKHAIRFTAPATQRAFVWPARHFASRSADPNLPPMGLRMRLKADFDISGFSKETQVILRALKKYGMILADNGGAWFITGTGDPHWPGGMTEEMRRVVGSNFEAVDTSSLTGGPNSGAVIH